MTRAAQLNITELVIRKGGAGLSFRTNGQETTVTAQEGTTGFSATPPERTSGQPESPGQSVPPREATVAEAVKPIGKTIDSPLVGKFYTASAPSKPIFVNIGDTVKAGDTVCIVEAMKLINEIKAPTDCVVLKILVANGENVDKGQPLLLVEEI